ncbi:MAG: glycogen/starch/alpha-glucan phosphorylase [Candidatus Eisenbacteria bacterium]|nr:glycogen/starch/alpha-glucan phosphorylase [Candidatus Eisenbacteria bacterium]
MRATKSVITQRANGEDIRTGLSEEAIRLAFLDNLFYLQGRTLELATTDDKFKALAYTVRDRMLHRLVGTVRTYQETDARTVCYLSAEYLPGPHLDHNLLHLGILDTARRALAGLGVNLDELVAHEEEPGLGNGGLGRLAACFMDSLATLEIPAIGYGIRYEFGIFDQVIRDGWQHETTDTWLRFGSPWEVRRPHIAFDIGIGGRTESYRDADGIWRRRWLPHEIYRGVANDTPILGHGVNNVNTLRLWSAEAAEGFDFQAFNQGDYAGAVVRKVRSETISKVLYPNDEPETGKRLRLLQQFFFVTCSLQDMLRILCNNGRPVTDFPEKFAVQLNDTHPAIAVAELMRLLVDDQRVDWDDAWALTQRTFAYTNHTLLPEALETWPVSLFENVLPRHMEIIHEINRRFLEQVRERWPDDPDRVRRMSLVDESGARFVRMANLACVGSHAVNGVAELHTRLLGETVLRDFHDLWPEKFQNKTNGVTPRRFLMLSNPELSTLLTRTLGAGWERDLGRLKGLERHAGDPEFQREWRAMKLARKQALAEYVRRTQGERLDPTSLFDVLAKRIHEYKRQHLKLLHVVTLYNRIRRDPHARVQPRTFVFGGKAAPGYAMAKLIIKLANSVGSVVNRDPAVAGRLKVVFLPNYSVKLAQWVYPAADLSEQISTAGKEASGTGNMKFALNGALTVGTLDGANVEIRDEVGAENFFLFGLTAEDVARTWTEGYDPRAYYESDGELREAIDTIGGGLFSPDDPTLFHAITHHLLWHDTYRLMADYRPYVDCQDVIDHEFADTEAWTRKSILNVARMAKFSSDRTIGEYARDIWNAGPVAVRLPQEG